MKFINLLSSRCATWSCFAASYLQQQILRLQIAQLVTSNKIMKNLITMTPIVKFFPFHLSTMWPWFFSDATQGNSFYSSTRYISWICLFAWAKRNYHIFTWMRNKQSWVPFYSAEARFSAALRFIAICHCWSNDFSSYVNQTIDYSRLIN